MKLRNFLLLLTYIYSISCSSSHQWCWTKSQSLSEKPINSQLGGSNWGWCRTQGPGSNEKIPYRIYVETTSADSPLSSGPFYLTLYGEEGQSEERILTEQGFTKGATTVLKILAKSVGDVTKIKLRNGGNDPYKCEKIRVETKAKFWDFECEDFISCPKKCYDTLYLAGTQKYEVSVKTSTEMWSDTKSPIYIQFIGTQGKTSLKLLTDSGFSRGDFETITIQARDVGFVYGVILTMTKSETWTPIQIIVRRSEKEQSIFDPKGQSIKCPLRCSLTIMNPRPGDYSQEGILTQQEGSDEEAAVINDYLGGGLTSVERSNLVRLSCDSIIKNNKNFGPQYASSSINYMMVLAICPSDCYKVGTSKVFGLGIHPEESSICKSAIIDRAMPLVGGVIGISISNGLDFYERGDSIWGLEINSYRKSMKSFYTHKVDNVDFIEKDIRILTNKGTPSYIGRVEFRLGGQWGSICLRSMTNLAAKRICKDLNYKDGFIRNPPSTKDISEGYCRNFNGEDYCAPDPLPIHYMNMNCEGSENSIFECYREIANSELCTHSDDVIIECTNSNKDVEKAEMGSVRLLDYSGKPSDTGSGRLEYYKGNWGTVCNEKFNDKAAHVACRQMGYDTGQMIGNEGQLGVCSSFSGKNYCGNSETPINIDRLECLGFEATISGCGGTTHPIECSHDQDVIVQCVGTGDPSGKTQKIGVNNIGPPSLGKLPMIPIISAKCETKASEHIFRGDPGSIFLVNCPESCSLSEFTLWGAGVYTTDSSICKAAIHAGVLFDNGGLVELIKMAGVLQYQGIISRGISSTSYGGWKSSFSIAKPNSLAIRLSQAFGSKSKIQTSFIESKSEVSYTINEVKPIFQWLQPNPNFVFNGQNTFLDTSGINGVERTSHLLAFSLVVKVEMNRSPIKQQTIVSHSGCGGYALIVAEDNEIIFKARCTQNEFHSGFIMPLNEPINLAITYDTLKVSLYVNGIMFQHQKKQFYFKCDRNLDIGGYSEVHDEVWNGAIFFLQIYDEVLSPQLLLNIVKNGPIISSKNQGGRKFTLDGRVCISACTTNPSPNKSDKNTKTPAENDNVEGITESDNVNSDKSLPDADLITKITSVHINCETQATDSKFIGPSGKQFRVNCPKECIKNSVGNVFGSYTYTDDSLICKAGIHSGILKDNEGGEIILVLTNGEENYDSSFQNGIQSAAHGPHTRSIMFKEAPSVLRIDCEESARTPRFIGTIGTKFSVFCAKQCSKQVHNVFGDGIYTDDSSICQSAIHAGYLTDRGGEIQFMIEEGKSMYEGNAKNGIISERRKRYLRSFRVMGDQVNTCDYFKEKYNPASVFANWKVHDSRGARLGPSSWTFNKHPSQYGLAIRQNSFIQGDLYNYGSALLHKKFDCANAELNVNVYLTTTYMAVIFFRYYDENNFYALEINSPGGSDKIKLVKKIEGVGGVIAGSTEACLPRVWYRFKIVFKDNVFLVFRQIGNLRNTDLILNATDDNLQRGTVGVGVQGNNGAFFDGIETHQLNERVNVKESRIWDQCLISNEDHRQKFCRSLYGSFWDAVEKCEKIHNFCELCCDSVIPKLEQVLNYGCWKGCVKEEKLIQQRKKEQELAEIEIKDQMKIPWRPTLNEKVDFKPRSMGVKGYFVSGKVLEIDSKYINVNNLKEIKLLIKFYVDGKPGLEEIIYPNPNLVRCGEILNGRSDC